MKPVRFTCVAGGTACTLLLLAGAAFAQPDVNNAPKADNPANWAQRGGAGGRGGRAMTAEDRQRMLVAVQEARLQMMKQLLTNAGYPDADLQAAVGDFVKEQETAQQKLQEKWQQVNEAVRNNAVTEAQIATLTNDLRAMIEDEKARRTKSEAALDAKISYSKKPKLDALLMTLGLTGDEAAFMNGLNTGGTRRMMVGQNVFIAQAGPQGGFGALPGGNFGGPQGGFGGPQGGAMTFGAAQGGFGALAENGNQRRGGGQGGNNNAPAGFGGFANF